MDSRKTVARGGLFSLPQLFIIQGVYFMFYALLILTIIYGIISHIRSRYQRVFVNVVHFTGRSSQELAMALNPLWLGYLVPIGTIIAVLTVGLSVYYQQWFILGLVIFFATLAPVVIEIIIPLPSTRTNLLWMKHELKKNINRAASLDANAYAQLVAIDVDFHHTVKDLLKVE